MAIISPRMVSRWQGRARLLPCAFLVFAVPSVIFMTFNMPLFQNPDEPAHFLRAVQVAGGEFLGVKRGEESGGHVDSSALQVIDRFTHIPFQTGQRVTVDRLREARQVTWSGERIFVGFPNTAMYPPFLYTPVIAGVAIAKAAGLSPYQAVLLGRLLNALAAVGLGFAALMLCRQGRLLLFSVLLLPMSLSLYASCSQDALLITLSALAIALVSRMVAEERHGAPWELTLVGVAVALVAMARLPYAPLVGLLFIPAALPDKTIAPAAHPRPAWLAAGMVIAATGAWVATVSHLQVPLHVASPPDQLAYLLAHPAAIPMLAIHTLGHNGTFYTSSFVGILGWLDTSFPTQYYDTAYVVLGLAALGDAATGTSHSRRAAFIAGAVLLIACLCIFAILYLTWTAVGNGIVDGVQGRYFLPLAPLLAFLLPRLALPQRLRLGLAAAVMCFPLVTILYLPRIIIERYYLM